MNNREAEGPGDEMSYKKDGKRRVEKGGWVCVYLWSLVTGTPFLLGN